MPALFFGALSLSVSSLSKIDATTGHLCGAAVALSTIRHGWFYVGAH